MGLGRRRRVVVDVGLPGRRLLLAQLRLSFQTASCALSLYSLHLSLVLSHTLTLLLLSSFLLCSPLLTLLVLLPHILHMLRHALFLVQLLLLFCLERTF